MKSLDSFFVGNVICSFHLYMLYIYMRSKGVNLCLCILKLIVASHSNHGILMNLAGKTAHHTVLDLIVISLKLLCMIELL